MSSTLGNTCSVEPLAESKVDWLLNNAGFKVEAASERPSDAYGAAPVTSSKKAVHDSQSREQWATVTNL